MSVYIKGMEMPLKCIECKLMRRCGKDDLDYVCMPARVYIEDLTNAYKPRPEYCPLIPVLEHGRLIDVDALLNNKSMGTQIAGWGKMYHETCIEYAPTVIPASKEE